MKILVIGGGLFGSSVASILSGKNVKIDLAEAEDDIMKMASRVNHNRIHLGYHYLRSIATAEQSIEGLLSFLFHLAMQWFINFQIIMPLQKKEVKTTPSEFLNFCENVGIGYDEETPGDNLLDPSSIEACFRVPEPIWDFFTLKKILKKKLANPNINILLKTKCIGLKVLA
jgi:hypothetical protein